jgi:acetolactate synthase-1/2/3 large subunit
MVGGGAFAAPAQLADMAQRWQAPVIMTNNGSGAIPADHRLAYNMLAGQRLWSEFDVVLAVGTRMIAPTLAWGRAGEVKIVRIEADPNQLRKPFPPDAGIVASADAGLRALLDAMPAATPQRNSYLQRCASVRDEVQADLQALEPQSGFARALRDAMPRDAILAVDVTQMASFARYGGFACYEPRTLLAPGYQATLGFAVPAAIGAKVANPERKVVAIAGDGGFMFTATELATAVHHNIAVVIVVFDNSSYGNVKTIQANQYGSRHIAVELSNPDFAMMAKSYGMVGETAHTPEQLQQALSRNLQADVPALIHVPIGEVPSIWKLVSRPPSAGTPNA